MFAFRSCRKQLVQRIPCLVERVGTYASSGGGSIQQYSSSPEQRLAGQVAVITGGASGIGAATARLFTEQGARVVIADIQPSLGEKLAKEIGPSAEFVYCDVRKEEDIINAWNKAYAINNRLDIVYNNAGILGAVGPIDEIPVEEFDATMAVNVRAMMLGIKHAARLMKPALKGSIVCTASLASMMGGLGPTSYTTSKGAVLALVRGAAGELREFGIRVNSISPDFVPTPLAGHILAALAGAPVESMTKDVLDQTAKTYSLLKGRAMTELDIANAALYLASDMAGFITGQNITVDGGNSTLYNPASGGYSWSSRYMPMLSENGKRGL